MTETVLETALEAEASEHLAMTIKNQDACTVVCDGLKGVLELITTVWSLALVQACVIHPPRNSFRYRRGGPCGRPSC